LCFFLDLWKKIQATAKGEMNSATVRALGAFAGANRTAGAAAFEPSRAGPHRLREEEVEALLQGRGTEGSSSDFSDGNNDGKDEAALFGGAERGPQRVAYAAGRSVVLVSTGDPDNDDDAAAAVAGGDDGVPDILSGHTGAVECVCWIHADAALLAHRQNQRHDHGDTSRPLFEPLLASGAADGTVRLWRVPPPRSSSSDNDVSGDSKRPWSACSILDVAPQLGGGGEARGAAARSRSRPQDALAAAALQGAPTGEKPAVCALASLVVCRAATTGDSDSHRCQQQALLVACDTDGRVLVFVADFGETLLSDAEWSLREEVSVPAPNARGVPNVQQTASLSRLPGTQVPVLATAGTHTNILLFVETGSGRFALAATLPGHQEWIQGLSFSAPLMTPLGPGKEDSEASVVLASASQDTFVRLWQLRGISEAEVQATNPSSGASSLGDSVRSRGHVFRVRGRYFRMNLYAVLADHEQWVQSVAWSSSVLAQRGGSWALVQPLLLLTASMDKTMILWGPDADAVLPERLVLENLEASIETAWHPRVSVGAGLESEGIYGGLLSPCGRFLFAYSYNGALHLWRSETRSPCGFSRSWVPLPTLSGHQGSVVDCSWIGFGMEGNVDALVTVSSDQTTRVWGPWRNTARWCELSRAQVHGFDLTAVCTLRSQKEFIISSSTEKVIRCFGVPDAVLASITGEPWPESGRHVVGATLPPLGLSNKPVVVLANEAITTASDFTSEKPAEEQLLISKEQQFVRGAELLGEKGVVGALVEALAEYSRSPAPPVEDSLARMTLWPEEHKLYGHQYEVSVLERSHNGKIIASACVALGHRAHIHAAIALWDVESWTQVGEISTTTADSVKSGKLFGHTLSVQQLAFSPSDSFLVSISRDRSLCIWRLGWQDGLASVSLAQRVEKCHTRVVHCCSFSADDRSEFGFLFCFVLF
jgi:WD40 repeat protein